MHPEKQGVLNEAYAAGKQCVCGGWGGGGGGRLRVAGDRWRAAIPTHPPTPPTYPPHPSHAGPVVLVITVSGSGALQGYARMASEASKEQVGYTCAGGRV